MSQQACFSSQSAGDRSQVLISMECSTARLRGSSSTPATRALHAGRAQLTVDLRGASSLDSTMRSVLVRGFGDAVARGVNLALVRPNPVVWGVSVLIEQSHSFPAFGGLDEALASLGAAA